MNRDVYSGYVKLKGEEHGDTLLAAKNYAASLIDLQRYAEARKLLRKTRPVARRVLGDTHGLTLGMRWMYAKVLIRNDGATLDHLREAVNTLEETERTARRVLSGAHPHVEGMEEDLQSARAALRAASSGMATRTRAARARRSEVE